jgi:hypothetical protein
MVTRSRSLVPAWGEWLGDAVGDGDGDGFRFALASAVLPIIPRPGPAPCPADRPELDMAMLADLGRVYSR